VTAVASGAVLRTLNKENGPERFANSSYGFLRVEPWEPNVYPAHKRSKPFIDNLDDDYYVKVINYFMKKVGTMQQIASPNCKSEI
jgi:hypothetical protein